VMDYETIWQHVEGLPWCALVTTGRVGSDFFQSLLDGHPEVFVFQGNLFFHVYWEKSCCANYPGELDVDDIVDEFIWGHIWKFKSKYDYQERMGELGKNMNQSINIDLSLFRQHLTSLLKLKPICSKHFLQGAYVAYALCLDQDIYNKKLFFHHIHHIGSLDRYLNDFPESKIISMTRDPRATYVSGVENWRTYNSKTDTPGRVFFVLNRTIEDGQPLWRYKNDFSALKLEDLGNEQILGLVCRWIGVSYNPCLKRSTWGGLKWWSDRISQSKKLKSENGFSPTIMKNNWENKLNVVDKALLNYLLMGRLRWYSYDYENKSGLFYDVMMFLAIPLPTTYECRFLKLNRLLSNLRDKQYRRIVTSFYFYIKRVSLYYKLYFKKHFGEDFNVPFFRIDER